MPIDHVSLNVSNLEKSKDFYLAALKPLGYKIHMSLGDGQVLGLGAMCAPDFWLVAPGVPDANGSDKRHGQCASETKAEEASGPPRELTGPMHLAFTATTRAQVRKFHEAALAAGAKCNGTPGLRPEYFRTYYGAFVLDPDGRNVEVVCIRPGFWAEEWGVVGWGIATTLLGVVASGIGKWGGYF